MSTNYEAIRFCQAKCESGMKLLVIVMTIVRMYRDSDYEKDHELTTTGGAERSGGFWPAIEPLEKDCPRL